MDAALQELLALAVVFAVVAGALVVRFRARRGCDRPSAAGGCHGCGAASGCASRGIASPAGGDERARLPVLVE